MHLIRTLKAEIDKEAGDHRCRVGGGLVCHGKAGTRDDAKPPNGKSVWSDRRCRSDCIGGKPGFVICSNGREATPTPNTPQRRWQSLYRPRREWKVTVALGSDGQSGQITGRAERMPDNSWAHRHHHKPSLPAKTRHIKYGPPIRKHLGSVITAALSLWYSCG